MKKSYQLDQRIQRLEETMPFDMFGIFDLVTKYCMSLCKNKIITREITHMRDTNK